MADSGNFIASGQLGSKSFKGYAAPIFIWKHRGNNQYIRTQVLRGLSLKVNLLSISADEKFLCGCGEDKLLYIWDVNTGEIIFGQVLPEIATVMKFVEVHRERHFNRYELLLGEYNMNSIDGNENYFSSYKLNMHKYYICSYSWYSVHVTFSNFTYCIYLKL